MQAGALGQKTGAGFYKKVGKEIQRLDFANGEYVAGGGKADDLVARILKEKDPAKRMKALRESKNPQAQFLWAIFRDAFHYIARPSGIDCRQRARRRFRHALGLWPERRPVRDPGRPPAGSRSRNGSRKTSMPARRCAKAPLPAWVFDGRSGVHAPDGSYSAARKT